jgi:hypothetical protein
MNMKDRAWKTDIAFSTMENGNFVIGFEQNCRQVPSNESRAA